MNTTMNPSRGVGRVVRLAALCLLAAAPALGQPAERDAGADADRPVRERTSTRVYDARDLLMGIRHYPFRGTMLSARQAPDGSRPAVGDVPRGGAATGPARAERGSPERTAEERTDELVRLITESVNPDSWRDAGGTVGAVRVMSGQMIITQTDEGHRQIQDLLGQLRETRGKMVRVRAHWLLMSTEEAEKLFSVGRDAAGGQGQTALVLVDPAALRNLPQSVTHYHAQTVGYNNQTVHVVSGPARTVVTDVDAQVGTGAVAFDPVVELVRGGLLLEVTPLVPFDSKNVALELYTAFVGLQPDGEPIPARAFAATGPAQGGGAREGAAEGGGAPAAAGLTKADGVVDRLNTVMQEMRTNVLVPLNRPVLIGGMTLDPSVTGQPSPQLYLVVEVVASE